MKKILTLILAITLSGCGVDRLAERIDTYKGQNISTVVNKLGFPDAEKTIMGKKVYIWGHHNTVSVTVPTTNYNTGYVGTQPYSYSTTTYQQNTFHIVCTLEVIVGQGNIIESWKIDGNSDGCNRYASRLK